jgi:hypothetical protein
MTHDLQTPLKDMLNLVIPDEHQDRVMHSTADVEP